MAGIGHRGFMGRKKSSFCPYLPGLYSESEIDDLVFIDGYIPVYDAAEFDKIRTGAVEEMGGCTKWGGNYTTGVDKKYVQVGICDFTSFGTWTTGFFAFTGIFDGNEININNLTSSNPLFFSAGGSFTVKNMRVGGVYSVSDSSFDGKSPIIGTCGTGTVTNNHYTGNVTNALAPDTQALSGIIGLIIGAINVTVTDNSYTGTLTSAGGNHVGMIIGRGDGASGTLTISGNTISGSISTGSSGIVGAYAGSVANAIITQSNSMPVSSTNNFIGGIVGRCQDGPVVFNNCSNSALIEGNGFIGGLLGDSVSSFVTFNDSYNTGEIRSSADTLGGICGGANSSTYNKCYNLGQINSTSAGVDNGGGLLGKDGLSGTTTFNQCYNTGNITISATKAGGLIGRLDANINIDDCYNLGNCTSTGSSQAGGLIGASVSSNVNIDNSYSAAVISASGFIGGLIGNNFTPGTISINNSYWDTTIGPASSSGGGTGQTTSALQTPTSNTGIYSAWTIPPWDFGTATDYPTLTTTP